MWRARPVFISSTFADMQAERDHLRAHLFPEFEERLRKRRHNLEWVDLRLGVATASLADGESRELQVLKVCLAEVRRSRPFLIVLLGDRYGWVPPPDRVSSSSGTSTGLRARGALLSAGFVEGACCASFGAYCAGAAAVKPTKIAAVRAKSAAVCFAIVGRSLSYLDFDRVPPVSSRTHKCDASFRRQPSLHPSPTGAQSRTLSTLLPERFRFCRAWLFWISPCLAMPSNTSGDFVAGACLASLDADCANAATGNAARSAAANAKMANLFFDIV